MPRRGIHTHLGSLEVARNCRTFVPRTTTNSVKAARRTLRRMRRRPQLITPFGNGLVCGRNDPLYYAGVNKTNSDAMTVAISGDK